MSIPVKDRFKQEGKPRYVGGDFQSSWLKLGVGVHRLRLCPPWDKEAEERGEPFLKIEQHNMFTDSEGRRRMPICLDYVVSDQRIATLLASKGKLTKDDFQRIRDLGCPMCAISQALISKKDDKDDKDFQKFNFKTSYLWNAVVRSKDKKEDGKCYMYSTSPKFFKEVGNALETRPLLFDAKKGNDFAITASGEGLTRKYTAPAFYDEKTPLGLQKGAKIHNLDDAMIYGVRTYDEMLQLIRTNHTTVVKKSGINLNNFM